MKDKLAPMTLGPYSVERWNDKILITDTSNHRAVGARAVYESLLQLMDGRRTLPEILLAYHRQGHPMWLREISRLLEQLQQQGLLLSGGPAIDEPQTPTRLRPWFRLVAAKRILVGHSPHKIFFIGMVLLVTLLAGFGGWRLWLELSPFDFLAAVSSPLLFPLLLWALFFGLSLVRALVVVMLSVLAIGRLPHLWLHGWRAFFLVTISPEEIKLLNRAQQGWAWMSAALSPLCFYGLAAGLIPDAWMSFSGWICLFYFAFLVNPFTSSDFNRLINQIVSPEEYRHLIPFLKHKALMAFLRPTVDIPGELRLLLFGTFAIGWLYFMFTLGLAILGANLGPWLQDLTSNNLTQQIRTGETVWFWLLPSGLILIHLFGVLGSHLWTSLRPWIKRKTILKSSSAASFSKVEIVSELSTISFFDPLSPERLGDLVSQSECLSLEADSVLIAQGDLGNDIFVVLSGQFRVSRQLPTGLTETLTHLHQKAIFGGVSESQEFFQGVDVVALQKSVVLKFKRSLLDEHSRASLGVKDPTISIENRLSLARALAQSALFKDLPKELINLFFLPTSEFVQPAPGSKVIVEGQESDEFYVIVSGRVTVSRAGGAIASLSAGQFFGEMALLQSRKRTADVIAEEGCVLLKIPAAVFYEMLAMNWGLALNIDLIATKRGVVML